ncbi:ester cyclase [Haloarcula nitratireducens]|uniref:Ester cyclase n=1 Tax=Haloarcula nitratireducens TaxID=2487749 RepID=A0AAW4PIX4_9EURY|nr:ester cyclase [Halomicroarcula nitratireducens]MBX0297939.1 ester cyclase [Halomicroarcula nitratireducens]
MATTQTNKELFLRVFDALNERDFDAFADTHADNVVLHDHDEEFHGVDAATEHEQTLYEAFPDLKYTPEDILADEELVAARWRVTGTHEGELEGIAPTGEDVEFPACGILRVEDEKIAEVWLIYDQLGLMQQLGVVEPPGE